MRNKKIEDIEKKIQNIHLSKINENKKVPFNNNPFPKQIKRFMITLLGLKT